MLAAMGMIACVPSVNPAQPPCAIRVVGRELLSLKAMTYCNQSKSVDRVIQVPDDSVICPVCEAAIASIPRKPKAG